MLKVFDEFLFSDFYQYVITVDGIFYFPLEATCILIVRSFIFCTVLVTCGFILSEILGELVRRILDLIHDWRYSDD